MHGVVNCEALQRSEEKSSPTLVSFPFLEFVDWDEPYPGLKDLEKMASPRLMKTHLRKYFFEKPLKQNNKIVVVLRNVKDTMVSYYHFYQKWDDFAFKGHDFDEFFELFREKRLCYGDWYDWVLDWWTEKDNPNVCFFFYENMKADIHKETRRLAAFLGKELTEEQFQFVVNRAEFDCMQRGAARSTDDKRENAGKKVLFRKGLVGDWRSHFSEQQAKYVDDLTTEKLAGTGLHFRNSWIHNRYMTSSWCLDLWCLNLLWVVLVNVQMSTAGSLIAGITMTS